MHEVQRHDGAQTGRSCEICDFISSQDQVCFVSSGLGLRTQLPSV